jgi:hypothetical protein
MSSSPHEEELPRLGQPQGELPKLGSLTQSARFKQLNQARNILVAIGILTMAVNGFLWFHAEKEVDEALQQQIGPGRVADPARFQEARKQVLRIVYLIYGGTFALGAVFVVLGLLVKTYPVPTTITGLVLYLGATAVFALLNPASIGAGIIIKIIVIVCLVKAIQSALAYQREERKQIELGTEA